jgi:putative SOS response-associated peptidase YedK
MPVILPHEDYELWLDPDVRESEELLPLLTPYPAADMETYAVSRKVNSPYNNDPGCIEPAA